MGTMFEIPGWEEFTKRCQNVVDKWDAKKALLLEKMGTICQAEIKAEIDRGEHVDTSRLIDNGLFSSIYPLYLGGNKNSLYRSWGRTGCRSFCDRRCYTGYL